MKGIKRNLICFAITLSLVIPGLLHAQDEGVFISGRTSVCSDDDVQTYSAFSETGTGTSPCYSYNWTVSGGTIISGSGTGTVEVDWNTTGSLTVSITSGMGELDPIELDPGDETGNCDFFNGTATFQVSYGASPDGTLSLSTFSDQELCNGESASVTANVTGDARFLGWVREGETFPFSTDPVLTVDFSDLTEAAVSYTAKASAGSGLCGENLSRSVKFLNKALAARGYTAGEATVRKGIQARGKVTVYGEKIGDLDHWERKVGNGSWEEISLFPGGKPGLDLSSDHYSLPYNQKFHETTRYRAILSSDCSGGTTESDEIVIDVLEYSPDYHSVTTTQLDENGQEVSKSANYFDDAGKLLQSQSWDNATKEVMASEPLYDQYDRPVGKTLHAPIGRSELGYKIGFFTAEGQPYTYEDFDLEGEELPKAVDNNRPETLGWFYSHNNSQETRVAETKYPYSISNFYGDGSGESKSASGPGDHHHLKSGKVGVQKSLPVFDNELSLYQAVRNLILSKDNGLGRVVKRVARDANNREAIVYVDNSGNTIATAVGGTSVRNITKSMPDPGERIEFHIPYTGEKTTVYFSSGGRNVSIYDLLSDVTSQVYSGTGGSKELDPGFYSLTMAAGFGTTPGNLRYEVNYSDYAFNFYNNKGQLIASMTPKGVAALGNTAPASVNDLKYTTFYEYDFQGRLVKMTEPDAGVTEYKYRTDGQIRLSKNADQHNNRFSYTNYDKLGRPIESGEIEATENIGSANLFTDVTREELDATGNGYIQGIQDNYGGQRYDWIKSYYDVPMLPTDTDFTDEFPDLTQEFVTGAVSSTESERVQTWYSYDDQGRVTWFLQQYKDLFGSDEHKHFLIEYDYDFFGNVTKVGFQPQTFGQEVSEAFWHYYEYDESQRLEKVYTSVKPDEEKYLHATYKYYKHGPLKRVELAEGLQGIDYIYTPQGWLKAINHPVREYDPGEDGKNGTTSEDVFAMTLEYFEGDYARENANIGSVNLDDDTFTQQNNGNIRSMLFGELSAEEYETVYRRAEEYDFEEEESVDETLDEDTEVRAEGVIYLEPGFDSNWFEFDAFITPDQLTNDAISRVTGGEMYVYQYDRSIS